MNHELTLLFAEAMGLDLSILPEDLEVILVSKMADPVAFGRELSGDNPKVNPSETRKIKVK